jgi:hypothetical protein
MKAFFRNNCNPFPALWKILQIYSSECGTVSIHSSDKRPSHSFNISKDPWGISANVTNYLGLFVTHSFTNSNQMAIKISRSIIF